MRPPNPRFLWLVQALLGLAAPPEACRFSAEEWSGPLRVASAQRPFVQVESGHSVTVVIPEGDAAQGARVSVEVLGVQLSALAAASDLALYSQKPKRVAGYVWTGPATELRWVRASASGLAYHVVLPATVLPVGGPPMGEQPCRELAVESAAVDEGLSRAILGGQEWVLQGRWRGDEQVPLAHAPRQPPLAFLDTRAVCDDSVDCDAADPDEVLVLDARAHWLRVAYVLENVTVVGWVPDDTVQRPFVRAYPQWFDPLAPWAAPVERFGADDPTVALDDAGAFCAWNAPFAVETAGVVRTVGTLASGIPLAPGAQRQGWREVTLAHPSLSFAADARLWIPEHLQYRCGSP